MKKTLFIFVALCMQLFAQAQSIVIKLSNGEEVRYYYHNIQNILIRSNHISEDTPVQGIPIWQYKGKKVLSAQLYKELSIALKSDLSLETNDCSGYLDNIQVAGDFSKKIQIRYYSDEVEYEDDVLESISLPENLQMVVGETQTLTPEFSPEGAISDVTWSSDNENIATVDDNGVVTAVGKGTATISCVSDDAQHAALCQVSVYEKGDVNGDGEVTPMDASLILQILAKKIDKENEGIVQSACDVNGDKELTPQDASLILQYIAKKITW